MGGERGDGDGGWVGVSEQAGNTKIPKQSSDGEQQQYQHTTTQHTNNVITQQTLNNVITQHTSNTRRVRRKNLLESCKGVLRRHTYSFKKEGGGEGGRLHLRRRGGAVSNSFFSRLPRSRSRGKGGRPWPPRFVFISLSLFCFFLRVFRTYYLWGGVCLGWFHQIVCSAI